jgi:DNA helicase-2/ATP-dependent DNA helicase PcrA
MGPVAPRNITWESADATRSPAAQQILDDAGAGEPPFRAGDKVSHPTFGRGMVVSVNGTGGDMVISVAFPAKGIKKLDPEYASLEKLG